MQTQNELDRIERTWEAEYQEYLESQDEDEEEEEDEEE